VGTVTQEEKESFTQIKERLRILLEHQLTNFRFCFPFGRPEGALKATISLLERVIIGVARWHILKPKIPIWVNFVCM
jgi:hypothetical protein